MLYAHDTRKHTRMHVHAGWVVFTCGVAVPLCVFDMSASPSTEFPDADDLERDHERGVRWWEVSSGCEEVQANRGWAVITDANRASHGAVGRRRLCLPTIGVCGEVPHTSGILWGAAPPSGPDVGSWRHTVRARILHMNMSVG